jgi:hypothetical protein
MAQASLEFSPRVATEPLSVSSEVPHPQGALPSQAET